MKEKLQMQTEQLKQQILASQAVKAGMLWYGEKNQQEQLILKALALFVAIMLVVLLVISPMIKSHQQAEKKLEKNLQLYSKLAENAGRFGGANSNSSAGRPILQLVTSQAKARNISLKRFEPDGNKLKVWFESVSFDATIGLLEELTASHGIAIEQISVDKSSGSGRADIRATLTR